MIKLVPTREITLNVCQGIGDIIWVYQKFCHHFSKINFNIMTIGEENELQTRAKDFLHLLPQVGFVKTVSVTTEEYMKVVEREWSMYDIVPYYDFKKSHDYSCNLSLEKGKRLEKIDPDYYCASSLSFPYDNFKDLEDYVLVYVSGSTKRNNCWKIAQWKTFIRGFYDKYDLKCPLLLIGARYDEETQTDLLEELSELNITCKIKIDSDPKQVLGIIKKSKVFLAYQSGLSILADHFDVKQVMMYYDWLEKLMYSWSKLQNIKLGRYRPFIWSDPRFVLDSLKSDFLKDK